MIKAYRAADVRAAEAPLLAAGEPLMERASGALALATIREVSAADGPSTDAAPSSWRAAATTEATPSTRPPAWPPAACPSRPSSRAAPTKGASPRP